MKPFLSLLKDLWVIVLPLPLLTLSLGIVGFALGETIVALPFVVMSGILTAEEVRLHRERPKSLREVLHMTKRSV